MIIVSYDDGIGASRIGVRTAEGIAPTQVAPSELARRGLPALEEVRRQAAKAHGLLDEDTVRLGPPVPPTGKILCVGLNYLRHAEESHMEPPNTPVLFSKFSNAVAGPDEQIALPKDAVEYDYEAELVVVIGRRARRIRTADALGHVLGYCNGNDLSARDLQMLTGQWLLGKTLDGFFPLGPYLATTDEIPNPQVLPVRCWLNGELRQDSSTADMIFSVADIIAYASKYMTLEPGDVIATGTPEGVILGRKDKRWLQPGDTVEIEVGGLGRLRNTMIKG